MSDLARFSGRWRAELLAKARKELREAEGHLASLKNHTTGYYRAHLLVVQLKRAALMGLESVPLNEDETICHCGELMRNHSEASNHAPVEMNQP